MKSLFLLVAVSGMLFSAEPASATVYTWLKKKESAYQTSGEHLSMDRSTALRICETFTAERKRIERQKLAAYLFGEKIRGSSEHADSSPAVVIGVDEQDRRIDIRCEEIKSSTARIIAVF